MSSAPDRDTCHALVGQTVTYLAQLTAPLPASRVRQLVHEERIGTTEEAQVNAMALLGDVSATRSACRAWWMVWKQAVQTPDHAA